MSTIATHGATGQWTYASDGIGVGTSFGFRATSFTDNFTRSTGLTNSIQTWVKFTVETAITNPMGITDYTISSNLLTTTLFVSGNPGSVMDSVLYPASLYHTGVWGINQYAIMVITTESGTGSLTGPSVANNLNSLTDYGMLVRNGQWRVRRHNNGTGTDLAGPTAFTIPATLKITVAFNIPSVGNTVTAFVNTTQVALIVDTTGTIQATGIPAIWARNPATTDRTQWTYFEGGLL